jgi:uncharacterized membrane protein
MSKEEGPISIYLDNTPEGLEAREYVLTVNNLSEWFMKKLIEEKKQKQIEEKKDNKIYVFQMIMFLFLGINFLLFAIAPYVDIVAVVTSALLMFSSVLLFFYVYINHRMHKMIGGLV